MIGEEWCHGRFGWWRLVSKELMWWDWWKVMLTGMWFWVRFDWRRMVMVIRRGWGHGRCGWWRMVISGEWCHGRCGQLKLVICGGEWCRGGYDRWKMGKGDVMGMGKNGRWRLVINVSIRLMWCGWWKVMFTGIWLVESDLRWDVIGEE